MEWERIYEMYCRPEEEMVITERRKDRRVKRIIWRRVLQRVRRKQEVWLEMKSLTSCMLNWRNIRRYHIHSTFILSLHLLSSFPLQLYIEGVLHYSIGHSTICTFPNCRHRRSWWINVEWIDGWKRYFPHQVCLPFILFLSNIYSYIELVRNIGNSLHYAVQNIRLFVLLMLSMYKKEREWNTRAISVIHPMLIGIVQLVMWVVYT